MKHKGSCHCGAITVEVGSDRAPQDQIIGACQCSFCRKHNARAFSDPAAMVIITAVEPDFLQRYSFGLRTSEQIVCRRCGCYVAMTMTEGGKVWSIVNIDALDDRALFVQQPELRNFDAETREARIARRKARWCSTTLINWLPSSSANQEPQQDDQTKGARKALVSEADLLRERQAPLIAKTPGPRRTSFLPQQGAAFGPELALSEG